VVTVVGLGTVRSTAGAAGAPPTVTCGQSGGILLPSWTSNGYRVVLGVVLVPPAYMPQVVATHGKFFRPWRFWRKAGLGVRAGSPPVLVSVPRTWRGRAAITWGGGTGTVGALRLAACPSSGGVAWLGYPGGFVLQAPSACVPLVFRVGQRSATVLFGIGRRCGGS